MKIIDLLNKIANGEIKDKTKFVIKFRGGIEREVFYDKKEPAFFNCIKNISDNEAVYDDVAFDDEIELLKNEENKENKKIEELKYSTEATEHGVKCSYEESILLNMIRENKSKINELVRAYNKLIKESEEK